MAPSRQGALPVGRPAQRIDHPPQPPIGHRECRPLPPRRARNEAWTDAFQGGERHGARGAGGEPHDHRRYRVAIATDQVKAIADREQPGEPIDLDRLAGDGGDPTFDHACANLAQGPGAGTHTGGNRRTFH
jgi:hypothetical protein